MRFSPPFITLPLSLSLAIHLSPSLARSLSVRACACTCDTSCIIVSPHLIVDDFHFMLHFKNLCVLMATVTHAGPLFVVFILVFSPFYLQTFLPFICLFVCLQMEMRTSERTRARALATLHYTVVKFVVVRQMVKKERTHTHTHSELSEPIWWENAFCGRFSSNVRRVYVTLNDCVILF